MNDISNYKVFWIFIGLTLFTISSPPLWAQKTYQQAFSEALEAKENGDLRLFLDQLQLANSLRPNHRVILYNLSLAYLMNDRGIEAVEVLDQRTDFYANADFNEDPDFALIKEQLGYDELMDKIELLNQSEESSVLAFNIERPGFHPEGIAWSETEERFYLSDVRCGLILSIKGNGSKIEEVADLKDIGFWGAMGMDFDPNEKNILWVTSSVLPNYCEFRSELEGRSAVLKLDINTGKLIQSFEVEGEHVFGDLLISKNGIVYFTDSMTPLIYKIEPGKDTASVFVNDDRFWNLQGLTLSGKQMIVSDYITGLYSINMRSGEVSPVVGSDPKLRGTDGLYADGSTVYLIQNGTYPFRISKIEILEDGREKRGSYQYLDNATENLGEPTLGTIHDGALYFIANSPWSFYDEKDEPLMVEWPIIQVRRINLD